MRSLALVGFGIFCFFTWGTYKISLDLNDQKHIENYYKGKTEEKILIKEIYELSIEDLNVYKIDYLKSNIENGVQVFNKENFIDYIEIINGKLYKLNNFDKLILKCGYKIKKYNETEIEKCVKFNINTFDKENDILYSKESLN